MPSSPLPRLSDAGSPLLTDPAVRAVSGVIVYSSKHEDADVLARAEIEALARHLATEGRAGLVEAGARRLHQRDVNDPDCPPEHPSQDEWERLAASLRDQYRADAEAVVAALFEGITDG